MNIYSMKELDHLAVDMITDAFGKMSTWPVFDVRGGSSSEDVRR